MIGLYWQLFAGSKLLCAIYKRQNVYFKLSIIIKEIVTNVGFRYEHHHEDPPAWSAPRWPPDEAPVHVYRVLQDFCAVQSVHGGLGLLKRLILHQSIALKITCPDLGCEIDPCVSRWTFNFTYMKISKCGRNGLLQLEMLSWQFFFTWHLQNCVYHLQFWNTMLVNRQQNLHCSMLHNIK